MKVALIVLASALSLATALPKAGDPSLDGEWEDFKQRYGKTYEDGEEADRRAIFEASFELVKRHNTDAANGMHTYVMGINAYSDLTNEEFTAQMNGYKQGASTGNPFNPPTDDMPKEVDWRKKGYVTQVKDQKQCGSCWAFSTTGSLEGQHFKATGKLVSLSEQQLVDCDHDGDFGCMGGLMDNAFNYIKQNGGIDTEASYPYMARNGPKCLYKESDVGATLSSHMDVMTGSEDDLMKAVATVGPISVAIDAGHMSFQHYKEGVYFEPECSAHMLDHGVLAVGYGSNNGSDYWLVKNSWGTTWGDKGYIMMSRNKDNNCGIATSASYPVV